MDRAALAAGVLLALVIVTLPNGGAVHLTPFETTAAPVLSLDRSSLPPLPLDEGRSTRPAPQLVDERRRSSAADRAAALPRSTADRSATPAAPDEGPPVSARPPRPCTRVELHRVDAGAIPTAQHDDVVTFADRSRCRR